MITRESVYNVIQSFFSGDEPFSEVRDLVGQASSEVPEVFFEWFTTLSTQEKDLVAETLIQSILEPGMFEQYLPELCFLIVVVAAREPASIPSSAAAGVEKFIKRGDMVRAWLEDHETEEDDSKEFRGRWRYALSLWNLLWAVHSPVADEMFTIFSQQAKDREFARSIVRARTT